jgi:hypothetical protein
VNEPVHAPAPRAGREGAGSGSGSGSGTGAEPGHQTSGIPGATLTLSGPGGILAVDGNAGAAPGLREDPAGSGG